MSELGHAATMASATLPSTPGPAASVDARVTMMCAPPEAGVQVVALQSAVVCREVSSRMWSSGMTKAWLAVARVRMATMAFMVMVVVVNVSEGCERSGEIIDDSAWLADG